MGKIKCIKSVEMKTGIVAGKVAFTEGREYRTYPYWKREGYDRRRVVAAKNDWGKRHIIKSERTGDEFYDTHFTAI